MKLFENGDVRTEKKEKLIEEYPTLTEEDFEADNDDKLLTHLEQKLGKTKAQIRHIIENI